MAFWISAAIAAVILLLILAAVSRLRMRIRYSRSGELDELTLIVRGLYGAYRYRLIIPAILLRARGIYYEQKSSKSIAGDSIENGTHWRKGRAILLKTIKAGSPLRKMLRKVECTRFRLDFRVGTGDAPSTAVMSGVLWAVRGCFIGFASEVTTLKTTPYGEVEPVYAYPEFSVVWEADFQIRFGTFVWSFLKQWRGMYSLGRQFRYWDKGRAGPETA